MDKSRGTGVTELCVQTERFSDYEVHSSSIVPVPEPGTMKIATLGFLGLIGLAARKRHQ